MSRLTSVERQAIRALIAEVYVLRRDLRADADLVDAMCSLQITLRNEYVARVALRCTPRLHAGERLAVTVGLPAS